MLAAGLQVSAVGAKSRRDRQAAGAETSETRASPGTTRRRVLVASRRAPGTHEQGAGAALAWGLGAQGCECECECSAAGAGAAVS